VANGGAVVGDPVKFGRACKWECGCEGLTDTVGGFVVLKPCDTDRYHGVPEWRTRVGMEDKKFEYLPDFRTGLFHTEIIDAFRDSYRYRALKRELKIMMD
jgi:hypothetical protein